MAKKLSNDAELDDEVARKEQKRIKRILRRLKKLKRTQSEILTNRKTRFLSKTTLVRLIKAASKNVAELIGKSGVLLSKDVPNVMAAIVVQRAKHDLAKVYDYALHNAKTSINETDARFVLEGVVKPSHVGFARLV